MPKEKKSSKGNGKGRTSLKMAYDSDSRKKTYHRYQIKSNDFGIVGTVYIPHGDAGKHAKLLIVKEV